MTEPVEQNPSPATDENQTPVSPSATSASKKSNNSMLLPLIIVGVTAAGLLCVISLIVVIAFFTIIETDEDIAGVVGTVVITEDSSAEPDEGRLNDTAGDGEVLFEETFDSDANEWETGVYEGEYAREEVIIADGVYTLRVSSDEAAYVERELPSREFSDFILTLDITPHDDQEHYSYGVTFRQNEDFESYVIELGNDGLYAVFLFTDEWMTLEDWTFSESIIPGETNQLTIRAEGSTLTFLINGDPLTTIEDGTLSSGTVGFVVETFDQDTSAAVNFDNLVIQAP